MFFKHKYYTTAVHTFTRKQQSLKNTFVAAVKKYINCVKLHLKWKMLVKVQYQASSTNLYKRAFSLDKKNYQKPTHTAINN